MYTESVTLVKGELKQYIGTIRQITGKGAVLGMSGLINDSESALAVIELAKELGNKMEELPISDIKKESSLYWAYIENTKGEKLDFKNWNKGVIELIDDMDVQIEYIGEYIVNLVGLNKR